MQDSFSTGSLKLLFYRYKDTVYYPIVNVGILFVVGVFLLFQIVIPQFSQWFSVQREVDTIKGNIKIIQDNTRFLNALDDAGLEADVKTVTSAYPFEKDYAGIINALSQTSSKTGVPLPDFRLSVGESPTGDLPAKYQLNLSFPGSLTTAKEFISELEKTLPISAVTAIDTSSGATGISVEFYYHGFPSITINQKERLTPFTAEERELLAKLKTWEIQEGTSAESNIDSSEQEASASGAFPPPL
ncbi:MAG: hypothetical protein RLZZ455_380 [Candidatus Parcubacteria bacterium]|jgi:hypothetical protein